jgi:AcrR family transcriptional regulator
MLSGDCRPPGLRERKKARTREAIVDAALELFERNGFEATTVEDIAAAADVSPRTFFRYFDAKADVVLARNNEKGEGLDLAIAARPADEPPITAMRNAMCGQLEQMIADDDSALRELKVVMGTPELRSRALDHFHDHQDEITGVLAQRIGVGPDTLPARVMASVIMTAMWAVVDRWVAEGAASDRFLPMIDEAFDLLSTGFTSCGPGSATAGGGPGAAAVGTAGAATDTTLDATPDTTPSPA